MKLKFVLPLVLLCNCGVFSGDKKDEYISFRILNNELGSVLQKYHTNFVSDAQKEVNVEANLKCVPMTDVCREPIKLAVAKKYADRERTYNMCADIQLQAKGLLDKADVVCRAVKDVTCDEAKLDALVKEGAVKSAFELVSDWVTK